MQTVIRFHLDQHVDHAVAHGLRQRGVDVTTTTDAELVHASDEAHLEFAIHTHRVIVTHDADFIRHHKAGVAHFGIVYCKQGSLSLGETIRRLFLLQQCLTVEEMKNALEYL